MDTADARTGFHLLPLFNPSTLKPPRFLAMKKKKSFSVIIPPVPNSSDSHKSVSFHFENNNYNNYGAGGFGKGGGGDNSNSRSGGGGGGLFAGFFLCWAVNMVMTKEEKEAKKMELLKTVLNAVAWVAARMKECNDLRYQTLNAVKAMPVGLFKAMVMVLTCLNNVARGMSFVLLGRSMGSQKGRGGGGGCEGGVMSRSSKSKPKAKRKKTEEEKTFRRRAKYFLATLLVAGLLFWSLFGGDDNAEEGDEDELDYDD